MNSLGVCSFARERVNVLTAVAVAELTGAEARLSDGRRLPCGLAVWVAGLSPTPLVGALQGVAKDKWGHIVVDEQLRVLDAASRAPIPGFYACVPRRSQNMFMFACSTLTHFDAVQDRRRGGGGGQELRGHGAGGGATGQLPRGCPEPRRAARPNCVSARDTPRCRSV